MTVADYRALLEHIAFISNRAMTVDYKDNDRAICREAESVGLVAFTKAYTGVSVMHYGAQQMRHM